MAARARIGGVRAVVALVLCSAAACAPLTPQERHAKYKRTRGTLSGVVIEAKSGLPMPAVWVEAEDEGADYTASDGTFRITDVERGRVVVTTRRRDLVASRAKFRVKAGETTAVTLRVAKAPVACCRLKGSWRFELGVETAHDVTRELVALPPRVTGRVSFLDPHGQRLSPRDPRARAILGNVGRPEQADVTVDEPGEFALDLPNARAASDAARLFSKGFATEVVAYGYVHDSDKVVMHLGIENMGEGLYLEGKLVNGVIHGRWQWFWPSCSPTKYGTGSFVMTRTEVAN